MVGIASGMRSWEYKGIRAEKKAPSQGGPPRKQSEDPMVEAGGWEQWQVCRQAGSRVAAGSSCCHEAQGSASPQSETASLQANWHGHHQEALRAPHERLSEAWQALLFTEWW